MIKALILGAGFSKWAADLPVVTQLFDLAISLRSAKEEKRLALVERDFVAWKAANAGITNEAFVEWSLNKSKAHASRVIWYVARRLSDPFLTRILGGYSALMITEKGTAEHDGVLRARSFLRSGAMRPWKGIVTVNYDLLAEYALGPDRFHYGVQGEVLHGRGLNPIFPWQNQGLKLTGNAPIAKIHGSHSWSAEARWTSGNPGLNGKALIVAPSPEKTRPTSLEEVWKLAEQILSGAEELVFFGFAFNPYDEAVLNLLRTSEPKVVSLIDIVDRRAAASALWPDAVVVWYPSADAFLTRTSTTPT